MNFLQKTLPLKQFADWFDYQFMDLNVRWCSQSEEDCLRNIFWLQSFHFCTFQHTCWNNFRFNNTRADALNNFGSVTIFTQIWLKSK